MEGRLNWKYIGKILRVYKRERDNSRDRAKSIVSKLDKAGRKVRRAREREFNARSEAIGGLIEYITNNGKDMEV